MSTVKDQAICIRCRNYSETSQIVTLFGRRYGKISALAKGSRRERGKFGGGIDVLTAGEILFIPARYESNLAVMTEFDLQEPFPLLRRELLTLHCGQYMCELLAQFTGDLDPHETLYDTFDDSLRRLQAPNRPELVLLNFELALLREIGLAPVWCRCGSCNGILPPDKALYFSSSVGGMICPDCEPALVEKRLIEPQVLQILQQPQHADSAPRPVVIKAHELISYHQRELIGKQNTVISFVNKLLRKQVKPK